jgi:hypothetical protein
MLIIRRVIEMMTMMRIMMTSAKLQVLMVILSVHTTSGCRKMTQLPLHWCHVQIPNA